VGTQRRSFEVGRPETVWEMNYNLQPVFAFIGENLEPESDPKEVEFAAVNGMLTTLDPHSNLLPAELFREMQLKTTGEFGGLGIRITIRKGALTIISPLPDTPAFRMGMKSGDQIVRIEDVSTVNMPLDEAVSLLRGRPGTKVTIWVMRPGWSEPHKFVVTRDTIRVRSVVSKLLSDRIGYLQIQDFGRHTAGDLLRHLMELKRDGKGLKGLILDLRNNAGGLMKAAVRVADLFLDSGIIVATVAYGEDSTPEQRVQKMREEQRAKEDGSEKDIPLVVLVNSGSASASEILAGALKNLDRAILMGEQTFGKGTVQILNERVPQSVQGACLKLTVAEYLIPGDVSIQEVGVTPDIQLIPVILDKEGVQAFAQRDSFREEDIPAHLNKHSTAKLKPTEVIRYVYEEEKKEGEEEEPPLEEPEFKEDFEILLAKEFLLKTDSPSGSAMLDEGKTLLREVQKREQEKIIKKMSQLGVDWSAGSSQGALGKVEFKLEGEGVDAQGRALADKNVRMRLSIQNTGSQSYYQLRAVSESKYQLYDKREFIFGRVNPKETKTWDVPIKVPRSNLNRTDDLRFHFFCDRGTPPAPFETTISTQELPRPAFGFSWRVLDQEGNTDGLIQPGEKIELRVRVYNQGKGKAYRAKALLKNDAGKDLFLEAGKGRVEYGEIPEGQSRDKSFEFRVRADTKRETLPVELSIWDADLGTTQVAKILLPVYRTSGPSLKTIHTGLEVKRQRAEVRGGGDTGVPMIGFVKKGTVLLADRTRGKWYRIAGNQGPAGWIHEESVRKIPARRAKPMKDNSLIPFQQYTPPTIQLDPVPAYLAGGSTVTLKGTVEDSDQPLRDVAVWVGDDKVFLQSGTHANNPRSLTLQVPVRLDPGPNVLTVIAREGTKYAVQKSIIVTRPGGLDWDKKGKEPPVVSDPSQIEQDKSEEVRQDPSLILE
jgi:carboxyl-terminal processing protease